MSEPRIAIVDFLSCPRCGDFIVDDGSFVVRKFLPNRFLELRFPLCQLCGTLPDLPVFVNSARHKAFERFKFYLSYGVADFVDLWTDENE